MTDILKVNVSRSYLKGPTGADRKENVVFGDILECRGPLYTGALSGYRRIDAVNWSKTDARVGLFVKDADLMPYDETPTEPPPARYVEYHHDGIVERFVPENSNG